MFILGADDEVWMLVDGSQQNFIMRINWVQRKSSSLSVDVQNL
jgi:hypothetical protein